MADEHFCQNSKTRCSITGVYYDHVKTGTDKKESFRNYIIAFKNSENIIKLLDINNTSIRQLVRECAYQTTQYLSFEKKYPIIAHNNCQKLGTV